jgi:hypothetical protein
LTFSGILLLSTLYLFPFTFPYTVPTRGMVLAVNEWTLSRTSNGYLVSTLKDNKYGRLNSYSITEFQRGDVAEFVLNPKLYQNASIGKGDTLGVLYSNEEERRLLQLQDELQVAMASLQMYNTGRKPEQVLKAEEQVKLARQEFVIHQKLLERQRTLYQDSMIAVQDFELAENEFAVKQLQLNIAETQYQNVITGEKPEQIQMIRTKINLLKGQIAKVEDRLSRFTLIAPISGMEVKKKGKSLNEDILLQIADTSAYVVVLPVDYSESSYLEPGQTVRFRVKSGPPVEGEIIAIDNTIQLVDGRQAIFITALLENSRVKLLPGTFLEATIVGEPVTPLQYFARVTKLVLDNY